MGEFEKNQEKTDQQTDKPAFDQFDKEKGQQQQQGESEKSQDEFADEKTDKNI